MIDRRTGSSDLATGTKRRILVGEDDDDQAAMIKDFLVGEGFEVALTRDGAELLERARRAAPDLILLDGHMPILDGFHAAEELHIDPLTSVVPVLFLAGAEDLLLRIRALKPDSIDFLRKPYSPLELLARIGHVVGSRVLQAIGGLLRVTIRETDLAARYGGDEFVAILAHTSVAEGVAFAERFLAGVRELRPEGIDVSMSLGIAALGGMGERSGDALLADADAAAYRAKRLGGNRACLFDGGLDQAVPG